MARPQPNRSARWEKKGGYSGGKPASSMGPPKKVPSGAVTPSQQSSEGPAKSSSR
jgi:hypothetical protein